MEIPDGWICQRQARQVSNTRGQLDTIWANREWRIKTQESPLHIRAEINLGRSDRLVIGCPEFCIRTAPSDAEGSRRERLQRDRFAEESGHRLDVFRYVAVARTEAFDARWGRIFDELQ